MQAILDHEAFTTVQSKPTFFDYGGLHLMAWAGMSQVDLTQKNVRLKENAASLSSAGLGVQSSRA